VLLPFCALQIFTSQVLVPQKLCSCWDRHCSNAFENILTPKGITIAWWEHRRDDIFVSGPRMICFSFSLPTAASTFAETFNDTTDKKNRNGSSEPVSGLINCAGILVFLVYRRSREWDDVLIARCFILLDVWVAWNSVFQNIPSWHFSFLAIQSTNYAAAFVLFNGVSIFSCLS